MKHNIQSAQLTKASLIKRKQASPRIEKFLSYTKKLMQAAAQIHQHTTGEILFQQQEEMKSFFVHTYKLKESLGLRKRPPSFEVGKAIAVALLEKVFSGQCKEIVMPTHTALCWIFFLYFEKNPDIFFLCDENNKRHKLPFEAQLALATNKKYDKINIEIDESGAGGIFRYHDPESSSAFIGREYLLRISPTA